MGNEIINPEVVVKSIDVCKHGKVDKGMFGIKEQLRQDLTHMFNDVKEGSRTKEEYLRYSNDCKELFERQQWESKKLLEVYQSKRELILSISERATINLSGRVEVTRLRTRNLLGDLKATIERKTSGVEMIHCYNKENGNYNLQVSEFEGQLLTRPIQDLNALGLKNYLIHIQNNVLKTDNPSLLKNTLIGKLGGGKKGMERLLELSVIWGTNFESEINSGKGKIKKGVSGIKDKAMGFNEGAIEGMFKDIIISQLKNNWGNTKNKGNEIKPGNQELLKRYENMSYDSIVKDFENHFKNKDNITGEQVLDYLTKKEAALDQKITKKDEEIKSLGSRISGLASQTCNAALGVCGLPKSKVSEAAGLMMHEVVLEKNKSTYEQVVSELNAELKRNPENKKAKDYLKYLETHKDKANLERAKKTYSNAKKSPAAILSMGGSMAGNSIDGHKRRIETLRICDKEAESKEIVLANSKKLGISKEALENILESEEKTNDMIASLESKKNLTNEEQMLLSSIKENKNAKLAQNDLLTKIERNISDSQFEKMVSAGEIKRGYVDEKSLPNLKANLIDVKKSEQASSKITFENGNLHGLSDKAFLHSENNTISISGINVRLKEKGKYEVSDIVCSKKELENVLGKIEFFKENGLGSFGENINKTMMTLQESGFNKREGNIKFDARQKMSKTEGDLILKSLGKIILGNETPILPEDVSKKIRGIGGAGKMHETLNSKGLLLPGSSEINYIKLKESLV